MGFGTAFALVYGYSIRTPTLLQAAKIWTEGKAAYLSMGTVIARHSQGKLHCDGKKTSLASLPIELLLRIREAVLTSDEKWHGGPCFCCDPSAMAEAFGEEDGEEPEEPSTFCTSGSSLAYAILQLMGLKSILPAQIAERVKCLVDKGNTVEMKSVRSSSSGILIHRPLSVGPEDSALIG